MMYHLQQKFAGLSQLLVRVGRPESEAVPNGPVDLCAALEIRKFTHCDSLHQLYQYPLTNSLVIV